MFIYFPEYAYKKLKNYFYYTYNNKIDSDTASSLFQEKLKDPEFNKLVHNFKNNKINLPTLKSNHCNKLFANEIKTNLGLISNYKKLDNKIEYCGNIIEDVGELSRIIDKELTYAYEFNISKGKLGLSQYAIISIKACSNMMKGDKDLHNLFKDELIKRCAYLEMKYKFGKEIQFFYEEEWPDMDNLKLNEIVKKLIDLNFN